MPQPLLALNAQYVSWAHTVCASSAFLAALVVGYSLHYHKIVENGHYGYPDEWFPSVSATIGDRYPERSIFQILIALTSGPRFLLLIISFLRYHHVNGGTFALVGLIVGVLRTVTCGGWVYITSTDDHDAHDVFMIAYIILTIPWEYFVISSTPKGSSLRSKRFWTSISFFATLVPLVYWFIQHKVHKLAGAYSIYAYFEWSLIILDIAFDAWTTVDFADLTIVLDGTKLDFEIVDKQTESPDLGKLKPKLRDDIPFVEIITNTINSFMFWSVVTSLPLVVWYFPLWNMGISGFEVSILANVFTFLLLLPPLKKLFTTAPQIPRFLAVFIGVGSYKIENPDYRLLAIGIGCVFAWIAFANEVHYYSFDSTRSKYYATSFTMGLILSSIAKFSNYTNNPIWPILNENNGGWNKTGILIGIISALLTPKPKPTPFLNPTKENTPPFIITAVGLGSLLFSLHAMLTDSSTMITWLWEGYPISGPVPVPHGAITIVTALIGTYLGLTTPQINSPLFISLGCFSAMVLYILRGWIGYVGVLGYTLFLTTSVPIYLNEAAKFQPGKLFPLVGLVNIVLLLAHVWIVAYAFVPAGWLLRERTDIILGSSTVLVALGLFSFNKLESVPLNVKNSLPKLNRILISFGVLSALIAYLRFPVTDPMPYHPDSKLFTAGIWTIHFGLDNDMWASEGRMRDLIRDLELDVVGLLESDTQRIIMGNRDLTQQIAEELNMYADFGPGPNKHTWGAALLSKFPILNSTHHLLPSPVGELAPAIHATLDVYGELVDIVVFHSGQEEDEEDRLLQSLGVRDIMGSSDRPMVLLSYLVTNPLEGNYNNYVSEKSGMHDVDASDWDRWCEYILYKNLKRTGYARISRGTITDTEVQAAKFVVGSVGAQGYSQERIPEDQVPEDMRFPSKFYGEGVRGHAFHVFDEPRYFS
jgi:hypothetical protein